MKRIQVELCAMGFALGVMALFADRAPCEDSMNSSQLSEAQARAESAAYLDATPSDARLEQVTGLWWVTDGRSTAWIDARSGELVEVRFEPTQ